MREGNTPVHRRDVLKGVGGATMGSAVAGGAGASAAAVSTATETAMLQYFHTDWTEVEASMAQVADAGFGAIHVPPPQESVLTRADQGKEHPDYGAEYPHHPPLGYQPYDRTSLDSEFGTEAEFRSMIDEAHAQGVDVIVDVVLNHNGAGIALDDFPNLDSEQFYQEGGIEGWMYSFDSSDDRCYNGSEPKDPNQWECDPEAIEDHDLVGLPSLDWTTQHVQDLAYDYLQLLADCGADGVRWDAAKHIHNWVFEEYLNPWADELGFYTVGEVLFDPIGYVDEYARTGMDITDYPLFYTMKYEAFTSGGDFRALDRSDAGYVAQNPTQSLTLIANHDSAPPELEALARAFVLTYEGYPRLYNYLLEFDDPGLRNLLWIRTNLLGGRAITHHADADVIVYERKDNAVVALNKSGSERSERIDVPWADEPLQEYTGNASDTVADGDGRAEITVPAGGWAVYAPDDAASDPSEENDSIDDGDGSNGGSGDAELTIRIEAPTADGESVYVTGSSGSLTDWGTGIEGNHAGGDVWEVTIDDPGAFDWKTRRGPEGASGDIWETGDNHTDADLAPAHQGWEDGFDGTADEESRDDGGSDDTTDSTNDGTDDTTDSTNDGTDDTTDSTNDGTDDTTDSTNDGTDDTTDSTNDGTDDGTNDTTDSTNDGTNDTTETANSGSDDTTDSDDSGTGDSTDSSDSGTDEGDETTESESTDDGATDDSTAVDADEGSTDDAAEDEGSEAPETGDSGAEPDADGTDDSTNDTDDDLPGFGIGASISGIGGALLAGKRLARTDEDAE
ncbi:alpha-amylase domain-containing protein [Natronoarchaeum sp. GCM10025703]|uniref:alpha-amylase domain-containing protein n=1 Tax=unclassified Natronoarchaeum TaxID=2620183 RepID=UPI003618D871